MANDLLSKTIDTLLAQQGIYDYGSNALLAEPQQGIYDNSQQQPAASQAIPAQDNGEFNQFGSITPFTNTGTLTSMNGPYGDLSGGPSFLTDNSYGQPQTNYAGNGWNTVQGSSYQPPQFGPWGNPMSQYNGQSYDGSGAAAIIANLPQASQDYYSARGVQNFDPGNQYGSYPPVAMAPSGNAGFGGGIVPSAGVNIPTVQGGQPIASSDIGGTGGYMWGNQNNYGNGYAWGNNDGGEVG